MQTSASYRSAEPPRPTNVDRAFRAHEGDDWSELQSAQDSVGLAAFCFVVAMAACVAAWWVMSW